MRFNIPDFVTYPRIAAAGLLLLCLSLSGLFHQTTERNNIYTKHSVERNDLYLHGVIIDVPVSKTAVDKTTLNLSVINGAWKIQLYSLADGINQLLITANRKILVNLKCAGIPQDDFNMFRLKFHDGMIIFESANNISPFPTKNFSLDKPLQVNGLCSLELCGSYKNIIFISYITLALAVILLIIAMAPKFIAQRAYNKKLLYIGFGCIAGEITALAICYYYALNGKNFYPYNTFLFRPSSIGNDLFATLLPIRHIFAPYGWMEAGNYFPATYSFLAMLPLKNFHGILGILYASFAFFSAFFALKTVRSKNFLETCLLLFITWFSLPSLLLWQAGNLEMLVFIIAVFMIFSFLRFPALSAFLLAFIINIKLYPGAFGVLFLKKKYYKEAFYCFLLSLIMLFTALFSQGWIIDKIFSCFKWFSVIYTTFVNDGLIFSHSLFSIYRYIVCNYFEWNSGDIIKAQPYYYIISLLFFTAVVWSILKKQHSVWEIIFLLAGSAVLLPPVSFDYTLVLLYPSLWFFLKSHKSCKFEKFYILCWILLLIPENWHHAKLYPELQISVLIKSITLTVMMITVMFSGKQIKKNNPVKKTTQ